MGFNGTFDIDKGLNQPTIRTEYCLDKWAFQFRVPW
jgi:hypothetical protein